jgi:flagellar M-ring protein FliF
MPSQILPFLKQLQTVWSKLKPGQRLTLGAVTLAGLALGAILVLWAQTPDYGVLFSGLSEDDASAIVSKLKEMKVPYQLDSGGTTIKVPSGLVADLRLQMAGLGLPSRGNVGYEIFDKANFSLTDFAQRLNYQRALEGELARTIRQLSGVEQARVHVVIPQPTLYTDKEKPTTASVVLKLRPGAKLQDKEIQAVLHLVASSVEGLKPENVTVVDTNGQLLASGLRSGGINGGQLAADQLEAQRSFEKTMARDLTTMLAQVLGPGKALVMVTAELDWQTYEANRELFNPDGNQQPLVRSSHEVTETTSGAGAVPGGVPGTESNVPGYQQPQAASNVQSARRETTTNYELSKTVERIVRTPGAIKRQSIAVVVDSQVPQEQTAQIEKLVSAAAGVDPKRGDQITVASVPFDRTALEEEKKAMEEAQRQETIFNYVRMGGTALGTLLLLGFIFMIFRARGKRRALEAKFVPPPPIITEVQDQRALEEARRAQKMREQITTLAKSEPELVAHVIQAWMSEDQEAKR